MRDLELALLAVRERADERIVPAVETDERRELAGAGAQLAVALAQHERAQVAPPHSEDGQVEVVLDRLSPRKEREFW